MKIAGERIYANVVKKVYELTTFPEFDLEVAFYIIVIAGEKYEPETNIVMDDIIIESQKFDWNIVAIMTVGMAISAPSMQIKA